MVDDATSGTAEIVLDLPGFAVLAAAEYGGELEVLVETTATVADCPWCGRLPVVWPTARGVAAVPVPMAGVSICCVTCR